ncbi:MAG: hypothetical protein GEU82_15040 [Luteitalea sp.]|nr:hypothetical protein [Luteitalea sp.]
MTRFFPSVLSGFLLAAVLAHAAAPRPITLGVAGNSFTIDGSPTFLVFISYFDALRRAAAGGVDDDFAYLEGKVHGVRIFPNWWGDPCALKSDADTLFDLDGRIRPGAWRQLQTVLDRAAAHHLVVDLSLSRETVTDNDEPARQLTFDAYAAALTELVGSEEYMKGKYPQALIDVQNEWPRFAEAPDIEALLGRLRAADPQRILAASSSGPAYEPIGVRVAKMVAAFHDPRDKEWFSADAARQVVEGVRSKLGETSQPVYLQEPTPASAHCEGADFDGDASHFIEAMKHASAAGAAAWTFHTRLGFALREQGLTEKLQDPASSWQKTVIEQLMR